MESMPTATEVYCTKVHLALTQFYEDNPHIGPSHGLPHVMAVHNHATNAIESHNNNNNDAIDGTRPLSAKISDTTGMEIRVAAMLHDADDTKFFPPGDKDKGQPPKKSNAINNLPMQESFVNQQVYHLKVYPEYFR